MKMTFEVRLSPLAIEDLIEVHRWVQAEAGQATAVHELAHAA